MPKMIFVNLPVKDLAKATRFYTAIGCHKNEVFSDHQASSMVWSDTITFQLLVRDYFQTFTPKKIADSDATCEVLLALTFDSREQIDTTVSTGVAAGGEADVRAVMDMDFMYNRALADPDGHILELIWMNMDAASETPMA
ncbi:MAG: lactoylglutathione lyase [Roseovarius sp.]|uniref:VOC family protein n=1 Tax=Roseovarius sp. TaxID=1486281 RepID=UPI001B516405|nr:lactoylglutathione lyase [Roseovarius sp.]MBQ0751445.1 lactoylglutathione lyase [Roseovarius sp.]MBQ0809550.1 lactoylglutathione lyase [Roseovarius sp.]